MAHVKREPVTPKRKVAPKLAKAKASFKGLQKLRPVLREKDKSLRKACLHPASRLGWMFATKSTPWLRKESQS